MTPHTHIALLRPDKAGDAVKTLPALRLLRHRLPEAHVVVFGSTHNASLFKTELGVRTVELPADWMSLSPTVLRKRWIEDGLPPVFDRAVSLPCDPSESCDRLLSLIPATRKYLVSPAGAGTQLSVESTWVRGSGWRPERRDEVLNIAEILSEALELNLTDGIREVPRMPYLSTEDQLEAQIALPPRRGLRLAFCPMAGEIRRTHPARRMTRFLRRVARDSRVGDWILLGPARDASALQQLAEAFPKGSRVTVLHPTSFRALGAYFLGVDGVVAVDSGPLHLAQAMQVPSLGLLSGCDVDRWYASLTRNDFLVRRGLLGRFPELGRMMRSFRTWMQNDALRHAWQ